MNILQKAVLFWAKPLGGIANVWCWYGFGITAWTAVVTHDLPGTLFNRWLFACRLTMCPDEFLMGGTVRAQYLKRYPVRKSETQINSQVE